MKLEVTIDQMELRARKVRKTIVITLGIWIVLSLSIQCAVAILNVSGWQPDILLAKAFRWYAPIHSISFVALVSVCLFYFFRCLPDLDRARDDLRITMITQLQHQVAELGKQLGAKSDQ